jgi:hypothetical protein
VVTAFGYSAGGVPGFLSTAFKLNVTAAAAARSGSEAVGGAPQLKQQQHQQPESPQPQAKTAKTGCSYEFPGKKCPVDEPAVSCKTDKDCHLPACAGGCTCHGVQVACHGGVCSSGPGSTLCSSSSGPHTPPPPPPPPPPPSPYSGPWQQLPSAPVPGRQEVAATLVDNGTALVYVGGFSYSAPYSYSDVLKLSFGTDSNSNSGNGSGNSSSSGGEQQQQQQEAGGAAGAVWSKLPSLPYAASSMGVASIGQKVYVVGGTDYNSLKFCVFEDCNGQNPGLGKHLLILDLENLSGGWQRGPDLPGSPRWVFSMTAVGGSLYVIGGATTNSSVVDNWKFTPAATATAASAPASSTSGSAPPEPAAGASDVNVDAFGSWVALPDLPISSGNFQTNGNNAFMDRYILLVGGYQYSHVYNPNNNT